MFMDVRGFTPISEALTATERVDFINTLLAPLSDAIQDERGTIDKYIGDSIMAFWNAPVDVSDHATRACRAALKMRAALGALNDADVFGFSRAASTTRASRSGSASMPDWLASATWDRKDGLIIRLWAML